MGRSRGGAWVEVEVVPRRGKALLGEALVLSLPHEEAGERQEALLKKKKTNTLLRLNIFPRLHGADRRGRKLFLKKNKHHLSDGDDLKNPTQGSWSQKRKK
ncbi:hypothetical protein Hanom_Chr12g01103021 [Helianthus anomalus]